MTPEDFARLEKKVDAILAHLGGQQQPSGTMSDSYMAVLTGGVEALRDLNKRRAVQSRRKKK